MMTLEMVPSKKLSDSLRQNQNEEENRFTSDKRSAKDWRDQLASWALHSYQTAKTDRSRQERQWYLNLAFYYGQHYAKFRNASSTNWGLYTPPAPYYKSRPIINYIRKIVRKDIARLTSQEPNAYVIPSSAEDKDLFAAQASEQVWFSIYHDEKVSTVLKDAVFWAEVCGTGFMKQIWDDNKEDKDNSEEEGGMVFSAESPFHIFIPDLLCMYIDDQPWEMHAKVVTPEYVKRYYGLDKSPDMSSQDLINPQFANVMGAQQQQNPDKTLLLETCVKPGVTNLLPEGGYFTMIGRQIVYGDEGPIYSHNEYPISKIDATPSGKFYSDSIIVDLIHNQRELNRTMGQIVEAKNRMAKPQLTAEEGSIDASKMTTEPGQVHYYRSGYQPPQPLPLQDLPSYVLDHVDRELSFMSDLAGQHEVSRGQVPPGVTAATAISYLQEADDSLLYTMFDSVERAIERTARQTLYLCKEFWTVPHLIKVTGTEGIFDALTLEGADLAHDIRVEGGSALPTSKAAKQAFIMDLMTRGFIDPEEGLSVLEMGGLNKIYERIQVDIKQVQRENIKMSAVTEEHLMQHIQQWEERKEQKDPATFDQKTGAPLQAPPIVPVNDWDNDELHIEYHNRYRKSQSFEMANKHVRTVFDEHVKFHEQRLMERQTAAQLMGANPLEPGGAPSPTEMGEIPGAEEETEEGTPGPEAMGETEVTE